MMEPSDFLEISGGDSPTSSDIDGFLIESEDEDSMSVDDGESAIGLMTLDELKGEFSISSSMEVVQRSTLTTIISQQKLIANSLARGVRLIFRHAINR
jgi:hypothetical protein